MVLVLITNLQKSPLNAQADIPSGTRGLNFGWSLYLHFVYVISRPLVK